MKNIIVVISGPSGVGKGTIAENLQQNPKYNFYWAKSYTTRSERDSDKSENHYIFISEKEFKELENTGEILESNFYNGNWYGSSKGEIQKGISEGKNIIKDIDVNGGLYYKKEFSNAVLIFIKTDLENIKKRILHRGQNSTDEINKRLDIASKELEFAKDYDYVVINPEGSPRKAIEEIEKIINDEIK